MKIKYLFSLALVALFFTSCNFTYYGKPEELAVPVVKAVQDGDVKDAFCLIPSRKDIDEVVSNNAGLMGNPYYNKYSKDYRYETLKAKLTADFDIAKRITAKDNLDWDKVLIGNVKSEDINDEEASYSRVTVNLRFPGAGDYILQYNAVHTQNRGWYLGNDVYFGKPIAAAK